MTPINLVNGRHNNFWWLICTFVGYSKFNCFFSLQAHSLQLEAFSAAIKRLDPSSPKPKLQFVGSCRNESDEERLQMLKNKAIELTVNQQVEFYKNITYR